MIDESVGADLHFPMRVNSYNSTNGCDVADQQRPIGSAYVAFVMMWAFYQTAVTKFHFRILMENNGPMM